MTHTRLSTVLLLLATGSACGPDVTREALPASITPEASPAGEGSGEPFLSSSGDAVYLSWLQEAAEGGHDLWLARRGPDGWETPRHVAYGDRFFVNWADFPSVVPGPDGTLWAHWLQRGDQGGYDYGVRISHSDDGGTSWSVPWTPHEDGTPTEHGFVTLFPVEGDMGAVWLDGRNYASGSGGEAPTREMTLRFRTLGAPSAGGAAGPETELDGRTCDCCQTDAAMASSGPVVVYRDRSADEIRDVYIARWTGEGWSEGTPVHNDGWHIGGCPVNGPAVVADGSDVAVAWFTGANDEPLVRVAFSADEGRTFGPPVRVDDGNPAGRVDLLRLEGGGVLVSWLERLGGDAAQIRMRRVGPEGAGTSYTVSSSSSARASGFPRAVALDATSVLFAWTDLQGSGKPTVRVARVEVPAS